MIKSKNLVHKYIRRDEEGNIEAVHTALNNISIEIEPGSFVAILGHNGSGKSTLAKHINALLTPDEGTLYVDGKNSADEDKLWEIRRTAGMIFQNPDNQIIASVVEEDVAFGPENLGIPSSQIVDRVSLSLDAVGMSEYRKHSPNKLSGGQKQRVAIAGVMAMEPKCIIMDEPTAMLDPVGRKEVLAAAHRLNKEKGVTVILITHYMEEAIDSDYIFVMDQGEVVLKGTPREIFKEVEFLKEHRMDVPQITELAWQLRNNGVDIPEAVLSRQELVEALKRVKGLK